MRRESGGLVVTWSELTPEQRGQRREEIHRVLLREGERTQNAIMHRLALDFTTVGNALDAMVESGAVSKRTDMGMIFYCAIPRKTL
jgi:predicted ArsR family transcriptional regulator